MRKQTHQLVELWHLHSIAVPILVLYPTIQYQYAIDQVSPTLLNLRDTSSVFPI